MEGSCGSIAFSGLVGAMRDHFTGWSSADFKPSIANAKTAYMALKWTSAIVTKGLDKK